MMGFLFLALALLALVFWLIAPVLLGRRHTTDSDQQQQNIVIAKERLAELDRQRQQNEISEDEYNVTKTEIEFALLEDTQQTSNESAQAERAAGNAYIQRATYLVLSAIPFIALLLYQLWGNPDAISVNTRVAAENPHQQNPHQAQDAGHSADIQGMLSSLEAKLAKEPNNPNGWFMLGRSYMQLKQYDKAVLAFRELHKLVGDNPSALVTLADALAMANNGQIVGEPFDLAKRALALEPQNTTALWLTGLGYQASGDTQSAIKNWEKLLPLMKDDEKSAQEVKMLIANAREQAGMPPQSEPSAPVASMAPHPSAQPATPATSAAKLTVKVSIDNTAKQNVAPEDYVMIYAQRAEGMKMPLAMVRVQVKDLPVTVDLTDANALMPSNQLSSVSEVNVLARISKSGQAMKQPDDREVKSGPYKVSHADVISIELK
jgi:cytochrome c-type biogenesis protein CcmH